MKKLLIFLFITITSISIFSQEYQTISNVHYYDEKTNKSDVYINEDLIFITGHSAGGYLASMVGLDKSYLNKYKIDANQLAGIIPFSGQMISHFTTRKEKGIDELDARIDEMAPLHFIRADAPPLLLITGDREKELLGRYEENAYMWRMMKLKGHKETTLYELDGFDHGGMAHPAFPLLLNEIKRVEKLKNVQ
ncbi:alpha/beta hydrolase [Chryseobacterium indoltheticum]|jgi:acetyl esterase/lipase|uniref:alpha/beta hydrolase n=1 Tax=Chryseobacterium indoltheticum TaxID=254 RepID=UPI00243289FF|nr:prolyl oligopeptidase family serine peptidase [Chryseobacterium indoltheticum]MDF2832514.1 alpha/beta hydrolase [Chryseobacterium indoltheticum]